MRAGARRAHVRASRRGSRAGAGLSQRRCRIATRREQPLDIVIIGLTITSSWGNGHATTYRALVRELVRRGHRVLFLEQDQPWYAANRDLPAPPYGRTILYTSVAELRTRHAAVVRAAGLVIVGSYVPEGISVGRWVQEHADGLVAFYDIDTPVTLASLARGECAYLAAELIPRYHLYLSFTGGPTLRLLEEEYGAQRARPLYCSVDPEAYAPVREPVQWDLGYLGTYSADRQPILETTLLEPARRWPRGRFVVAGSLYPPEVRWPANVTRREHLPPAAHRAFYCAQRFTLNVTRADMRRAGHSPSVRLFEAAACGVPIISDRWAGLECFLTPGREILLADTPEEVLRLLHETPEARRVEIGRNARQRILAAHTAAQRAAELEAYVLETRAVERGGRPNVRARPAPAGLARTASPGRQPVAAGDTADPGPVAQPPARRHAAR